MSPMEILMISVESMDVWTMLLPSRVAWVDEVVVTATKAVTGLFAGQSDQEGELRPTPSSHDNADGCEWVQRMCQGQGKLNKGVDRAPSS